MKISFIIPCFNEERLLKGCISSVLRELDRVGVKGEVIVVNNASTDRSREIAQTFPGVLVVDEPQKGLSRARETGFRASSGELIAQIDADTLVSEGWLSIVLDEFSRNEKLLGLSGPYVYYDLSWPYRFMSEVFQLVGFVVYVLNRFVLNVGSQLHGGNCVIRRDALLGIGGYNLNLTFYGEDVDTAKRLHAMGQVKWTYRLPMLTSGRRIKHEGIIKTGILYPLNFFSTIFGGGPLSKTHVDVRD
jgi:glycosyltransferase involved in cell wall biosynthesis